MSKVKQKKRQHFVPQSYLQRFTYDGYRLFVFDKFTRKSFPSNIRDVAHRKYFYDFPQSSIGKNPDPQAVENILQNIEADFSSTIDDVLKTASKGINRNQKLDLAFFITNQLLSLDFAP